MRPVNGTMRPLITDLIIIITGLLAQTCLLPAAPFTGFRSIGGIYNPCNLVHRTSLCVSNGLVNKCAPLPVLRRVVYHYISEKYPYYLLVKPCSDAEHPTKLVLLPTSSFHQYFFLLGDSNSPSGCRTFINCSYTLQSYPGFLDLT